jgi:hypothetical protein
VAQNSRFSMLNPLKFTVVKCQKHFKENQDGNNKI